MDHINLTGHHTLLDNELNEKTNITSVYFDMLRITGLISKYGEHDGFFKYLSLRIFREPLDELELISRLDRSAESTSLSAY
jgi:hypothetical protein